MTQGFSNNDAGKAPVSSTIVVIAAVVLVLFIGGLAYFFLVPHSEPVHPRPLTESESYLQKMAKESQGDFNKLTKEQQQEMIQKLGPSAPVTLRMSYTAQQNSK